MCLTEAPARKSCAPSHDHGWHLYLRLRALTRAGELAKRLKISNPKSKKIANKGKRTCQVLLITYILSCLWYSVTAATAAAAKSLQSCLTLSDPIYGSPPGSPVPGILQARTLGWVAISFSNAWKWKVKVKSLSCDPMDCSPPGSSVHGIFQARVLEWGATAFSTQ